MGKVICEKEIYDRVVNTYGFPSELFEVTDERKRDEIAGLLYAMPEISADERLTAVMEVLEERGITTETLAEITGVDLDLIKSAREYPAKTDYRTKYELSSVVMMIYFILKEIIDENK